MILVRSDEEAQQVSELSREIVKEMLEMSGFINWTGMRVGNRMMTITAWENSEDHRQMYGSGTHSEAVRKFFGPELAAGGMTSVWTFGRFNAWVRCQSCMQMVNIEKAEGKCECGISLPELISYW